MRETSKDKIKLIYLDADKNIDQAKIEDVYDFIFEETVKLIEFDNSQPVSYPINPLVLKINNN